MMNTRITFYDIKKAGFYHYGSEAHAFGDIEAVLQDIITEFRDRDFIYTCPYIPKVDTNIMRTFLFDLVASKSGGYVLSIWNETPMFSGGIASVNPTNKVGTLEVNLTEPPEGAVPGYPTYFWFLPEMGKYATLVPEGSIMNGNQGMNKFMRKFMENFSRYAQKAHLDGDDSPTGNTNFGFNVTGYADPNGVSEESPSRVVPHFETHLHRNRGAIEYIRGRRSRIRKVLRRCGVDYSVPEHTELFRAVANELTGGATDRDASSDVFKINYDINLTPDERELDHMIDQWGHRYDSSNEDRVGFEISGEKGVWWLDSSLARDDFELPVREFVEGFPVTTSLLQCLEDGKAHILKSTGVIQ